MNYYHDDASYWNMLVSEYEDFLTNDKRVSQNTTISYISDINALIQYFQSHKVCLQNLEAIFLDNYIKKLLDENYSKKSIARKYYAIRSFLTYTFNTLNKKIPPWLSIDIDSNFKHLPRDINYTSLLKMLSTPDPDNAIQLRDKALLELLYGAGVRISEAVDLKFSDYIHDSGTLNVIGKKEKQRLVPLPHTTLSWLDKYITESRPRLIKRPSNYIFVSDRGGKLSRQRAYQIIAYYGKITGDKIHPHMFRHTYAVHLLKNGADLRCIQELLGHESINSTQVYTSLDTENIKRNYKLSHPRG